MTTGELFLSEGAAFQPVAESGGPSLRARRRRALAGLAMAEGVVCLLILPPIYALAACHGVPSALARPEVIAHLALNCAANLAVCLGALRARGRLDQRLAELLRLTLFAHGGLAFVILVSRQFYLVEAMIVGSAASLLLGAAAIYARSRVIRLNVGVLGPWHPVFEDPNIDCLRLEPEAASLRDLDLILLTFRQGAAPVAQPVVLRALMIGKPVRHVAEYVEEARGACDLDHFEVDQLSTEPFASYRGVKRALDIVLALAFLPIALPVVAFAALGVLATMGRPILFAQTRVGLAGRTFDMIKLRTMRLAPDGAERRPTVPNDDRITPLGGVLRRFRIDELPQLANVLRGEMSLIGPRPEWAPLADSFVRQEPKYALRHLVRPGITGWAQVRAGPAADLAETRLKLSYDLFYLKHLSFALDLQILWRTVWTLMAGGGAR